MTKSERLKAIELVNEMVAHGYHLMQYKDAADMVDYYDCFPIEFWQDCRDRWVAGKIIR